MDVFQLTEVFMKVYIENYKVLQPFLDKASEYLPFLYYRAIVTACEEKERSLKVIVLTHLKNLYTKSKITEKQLNELVALLDGFSDPYQEFIEKNCTNRSWKDIKAEYLGGILV